MGYVVMVPLFVWWMGALVSGVYFWATKTDRSQAPIERRLTGLMYGFAWPYLAYKYFTGREQAQENEVQRQKARDRILGSGGSSAPSAQEPQPRPRIKNPYDER